MRSALQQIAPREILVCEDEYFLDFDFKAAIDAYPAMVTKLAPWYFSQKGCYKMLCEQAKVKSLAAYGLKDNDKLVCPAGALIRYITETSKSSVSHLTDYKVDDEESFVGMDESSRKNLELFSNLYDGSSRYSLFDSINRTRTSGGSRLLKNWISFPLRELDKIEFRQQWVRYFVDSPSELSRVREALTGAMDLSRLLTRVLLKRAVPHDLVGIKQTIGSFFSLVSANPDKYFSLLEKALDQDALSSCAALMQRIDKAINEQCLGQFQEGQVILDGYDELLDERRALRDHSDEILKRYLDKVKAESGITEVFSKTKLITSAQNLYNTGLLAGLDYDLMFGQTENGVILDFKLEEGKTKDIQFGATFGGTLNQFPISGFVQWKDRNLFGKAQTLGVGVTLSPDTQSVDLSFGDSWFRNHRWSNSISLGFSRSSHDGELQLGTNAPKYYNGRNSDETWPLGYSSAAQWANSGNEYPSSRDLMKYDLFTLSLGWNTGYTFIYDVGRLSLFGGFSFSRNRAVYDDKYIPFERLINLYRGDKENFWDWKPSRKISFGLQWDGRDYITNTTKGYLLSTSVTYAGGFLGGLSNYIKLNSSAAGYLKLFSVNIKEEGTKNIMLCVSTSASFMFRQLYNYHAAYHDDETKNYVALWDPKYGATKYEMLYIDGMTIGRGFNMVIDQAFLWDNMIEISYPLVENLLQAELFVSATGVNSELKQVKDGINWYFAAGGGIKLKIQGFPLGLYLVKNWTYKHQSVTSTEGDRTWNSIGGSFFNWGRPDRGMSLVLAISTSLI